MRDELYGRFARAMEPARFSEAEKARMAAALTASRRAERSTGMGKTRMKRTAALALAAALALGALSAGAAYWTRWSRSMAGSLHTTEAQRAQAEESGLAASPDSRRGADEVTVVTDNGVTITAEQTIADQHYAVLSFRIEGFSFPEGQDPDIDIADLTVDGADDCAWSGGFYDGIVAENGMAARYDDGSPLEYTPDGDFLRRYTAADGSLEYQISIGGASADGLIGKRIAVRFDGLGTGDKGTYTPLLEGTWDLHWTLKGSDDIRTVRPNLPVGDTGAVLTEAAVSPISLRAVLQTDGTWTGDRTLETFYPHLTGVRLRDGTVYKYMYMGPGSEGWADRDAGLYETRFVIDRLLDPAEVDALVFIVSPPEGDAPLTDANLCFVPLR